jgi:hypothetical protein
LPDDAQWASFIYGLEVGISGDSAKKSASSVMRLQISIEARAGSAAASGAGISAQLDAETMECTS